MSVFSYVRELNEEFQGDREKIFNHISVRLDTDFIFRRELIEEIVELAKAKVRTVSTLARKEALDTLSRSPTPIKPRYGDDREALVIRQNQADERTRKVIFNYALFGGKTLGSSTKKDVLTSAKQRREIIAVQESRVVFEEWVASQLDKDSDRVDTLDPMVLQREWSALQKD